MIASHALRPKVRDIVSVAKNMELVKIGIMGEPSTGKSTLAETLAHLIHELSEQDRLYWMYRVFDQNDYLNFDAVLEKLEPTNHILYFHDLSFLHAKQKIEQVKEQMTKIRHLRQADVKIIIIVDYHYSKGLDKYLRQTDFTFITSVGQSELDNLVELVGQKNRKIVMKFRERQVHAKLHGEYLFRLRKDKPPIKYKFKDPFVLAMDWNGERLQHVVFPLRTWLKPICQICEPKPLQAKTDVLETADKKYGTKAKQAAKDILQIFGIQAKSRAYTSAFNYLYRAVKEGQVTKEQLLEHYKINSDSHSTRLATIQAQSAQTS